MNATAQSECRLPIASLVIAAVVCGMAGAGLAALVSGGRTGELSPWPGAIAGAASVVVAGLIGVGGLAMLARSNPKQVPMGVVALGGLRLIGSMFLGLFATAGLGAEAGIAAYAVWMGVLIAGMLSLVVETALLMRALGRSERSTGVVMESST